MARLTSKRAVLDTVAKDGGGGYVSPSSATSGIGNYSIEGDKSSHKRQTRLAQLGLKRRGRTPLKLTVVAKAAESVDHAAHHAATSPFNLTPQPSDTAKESGRYKKGHVVISGIPIAIENPAGSYRDPKWPQLKSHYGYIKRTKGADGDQVDCFVKIGTPLDYKGPVFVIDQVIAGAFDEHKCMIGWDDEMAARRGYLENFTDGWQGLHAIKQLSLADFKSWVFDGVKSSPAELITAKLQKYLDTQLAAREALRTAHDAGRAVAFAKYTHDVEQLRAQVDAHRAALTKYEQHPELVSFAGSIDRMLAATQSSIETLQAHTATLARMVESNNASHNEMWSFNMVRDNDPARTLIRVDATRTLKPVKVN